MQAKPRLSIRVAVWLLVFSTLARAETGILPAEHEREQKWTADHLLTSSELPFSFIYRGIPSRQFLGRWPHQEKTVRLDDHRVEHILTWLDAPSGLQVRCVAVEYADFPVVEWTCYLKNIGTSQTPLLEKIEAIDTNIATGNRDCHLHYVDGDGESHGQMQFAPQDKVLKPGPPLTFAPQAGRPTDGCFPCYDLDWSGEGEIVALGWPGQWSSSLETDSAGHVHVVGGQELTHLRLRPGEEIRTPRVTLLIWKRHDWLDAQNAWRGWMRAHNMPHPGGRQVAPIRAGGGFLYDKLGWGTGLQNEHDQLDLMRRYHDLGIKLNGWWIDITGAGTFVDYSDNYITQKGPVEVTWDTDRKRFPNGMRAVSDYGKSLGEKLVVWFEPEHVWPPNEIWRDHNDWLLPAPEDDQLKKSINQGVPLGNRRLLDLENPAARAWITDKLSKVIGDEGIAVYRQDFNITPLLFWRHHDADPDRQGMTENLYVQGYLQLLDTLAARHSGLLIDTCASGGRRDDLETLRRAVPLWKSDSWGPDVTIQNQTYGLALWVPYFGTGTSTTDPYRYASALGSSLFTSWDVRDPAFKNPEIKKLEHEFWQAAPFFQEDYYPLGNYDGGPAAWMAWQFNRPSKGDGLVQAFRRDQAGDSSRTFVLRGLDESANYEVRDLASGATRTIPSHELMTHGIEIKIDAKPGAYVAVYRKVTR